jgi:hypothetical protein
MGMPADGNERIVFNPVVIALVGCAFIGYHDLKRRLRPTSSPISATATPRS